MARADEFDAFYAQTRRHVLLQTYVVTADLGAAAAATRDAYTHAWQRWRVLRRRDTEAAVRHEAWQLAALRHTAHLRRRLDDSGTDRELLGVLGELPTVGLRLLVLQTLARRDLPAAAREVGVTDDVAVRSTDDALAHVQSRLGADRSALASRLRALQRVTDPLAAPMPSTVRRQGRRQQRRGAVLVAAGTAAALAGAGLFVTTPAPAGEDTVVAPERRQIGESVLPVSEPDPPVVDAGQLLDSDQISRLDRSARWRIASTSTRPGAGAVYPSCNQQPAADLRREAAYVRTFETVGGPAQLAVEAVEVSRTRAAATKAYDRLVRWYAGCQVPRVQLLESYTIPRDGTDVTVLELRQWSDPVRSVSVALTRSGRVTTVLAHEVERRTAADPVTIAQSMRDALAMLCGLRGTGDDECPPRARIRPAPLPPTGEVRGFLGVVDLPPVGRLTTPWVGTDPVSADPNVAATLCDRTDFSGSGVRGERSRAFVMPRGDLPTRFGITQTLGVLGSAAAAADFIADTAGRIRTCPDRQPSASVDSSGTVRAGDVVGRVWRLTYELPRGKVFYRVGLVRNGRALTQLTFSPTAQSDVTPGAFGRLLLRAGERLDELG